MSGIRDIIAAALKEVKETERALMVRDSNAGEYPSAARRQAKAVAYETAAGMVDSILLTHGH